MSGGAMERTKGRLRLAIFLVEAIRGQFLRLHIVLCNISMGLCPATSVISPNSLNGFP